LFVFIEKFHLTGEKMDGSFLLCWPYFIMKRFQTD
jgi:hypothetical protein